MKQINLSNHGASKEPKNPLPEWILPLTLLTDNDRSLSEILFEYASNSLIKLILGFKGVHNVDFEMFVIGFQT